LLSYLDVRNLFQDTYGIKYDHLVFEQVFCDPTTVSKKGLYVSIEQEKKDESLKKALYNGAVAAVWPKDEELPRFLPNHFPVFLVEDTIPALKQIMELYLKNIEENGYDKMTKFTLFNDEVKKNIDTTTIGEIKMLARALTMHVERRG
jgi:UDP-N-acetylmuramyl pentapeptide synthase